jgi:hypothetical protein
MLDQNLRKAVLDKQAAAKPAYDLSVGGMLGQALTYTLPGAALPAQTVLGSVTQRDTASKLGLA